MTANETKPADLPTLVVGATGMVGSQVCRLLSAAGRPVRALTRSTSDPAKVANLKALGADVVQGDLRDLASLQSACRGAGAVISTASSMPFSYRPGENDIDCVDREGLLNLIRAAQAEHVSHLTYTSFSKQIDVDVPLKNAKRTVEKRLEESGLEYTILRPSYFMEVWLSPATGFDAANAQAQIYGTGDQPISWISLQDVAAFAVASLTNPAARNATLELGGPEAISPNLVVRQFERAQGRSFKVTHVPPEALKDQLQGATDPMQKSFIGLMLAYAQGDPIEMEGTARTFGIPLTSLEHFVEGTRPPSHG